MPWAVLLVLFGTLLPVQGDACGTPGEPTDGPLPGDAPSAVPVLVPSGACYRGALADAADRDRYHSVASERVTYRVTEGCATFQVEYLQPTTAGAYLAGPTDTLCAGQVVDRAVSCPPGPHCRVQLTVRDGPAKYDFIL